MLMSNNNDKFTKAKNSILELRTYLTSNLKTTIEAISLFGGLLFFL